MYARCQNYQNSDIHKYIAQHPRSCAVDAERQNSEFVYIGRQYRQISDIRKHSGKKTKARGETAHFSQGVGILAEYNATMPSIRTRPLWPCVPAHARTQADKQKHRQTDRQTRQTDRHRQTDTNGQTQTHTPHTHTHTHVLSLSLSLSCTHTHTLSLTHTHTHMLTHSLTH